MAHPSARDLLDLPKVHLHLHLVGAMRPSTVRELARRGGMRLPPALEAALAGGLGPPEPGAAVRGFARFDALYEAAKGVLRRGDDLRRLVAEIAEDERAAGSAWVEITVNPHLQGRLGPPADVLDLLLDAGADASVRTGVGIGWIVSADRRYPERAVALAELAVSRRDAGVVGFGLANDERRATTAEFARAFAIARDGGLLAVPHAGELTGPRAVEEALDLLGAARIGHGVLAVDDARTLRRVADEGVVLEVSPTSNVALGVVPSLRDHPLPRLLAAGCRVSLAADDPLLFGAGLLAQYRLARERFGLGDDVLAAIAAAGIDGSAAPARLQDELRSRLRCWSDGCGCAAPVAA